LLRAPTFGLGTSDQAIPSQCIINVTVLLPKTPEYPTAQTSLPLPVTALRIAPPPGSGLEMKFQQAPAPSPLFALRTLAFLVTILSGNALEKEKNTAKQAIATMPGVKRRAFTMVCCAY
jgi:hypothetical protein